LEKNLLVRRPEVRSFRDAIASMSHVATENAQAGMVLAQEVVDARGRLLIPSGKELTDRHVGALGMWGISHIEIEGDAAEPIQEVDAEAIAAAEEEVQERFVTAGGPSEFLSALRAEAVTRSAHRIAQRPKVVQS